MKKGWEMKRLGEIARITYGYTEKASYEEIGPKFLRITDIQENGVNWDLVPYCKCNEGELLKYKLETGDIVFARTGATTGKSYLLKNPPNAVFASYLIKLQLKDKRNFIPEYIAYFFQTKIYWDEINKGMSGSAQGGFNATKLGEMSLSFPKSIEEQQRIVAILDKAFDEIEKVKKLTEENLKNAKELFESYLQGVFENKGEDWEEKTLGDVCALYQGIAINAKTKHALVEKSDLPLLRIKDLRNNTEEQYIDPNNYPPNALVNESDILYTRTGNSLGLVFRGRKGVLHNNSFKVVPNSKLDKDFLFIWLQNPVFKSKIMELAMKAAQPDITHAIFKVQNINIPPLKEQELIVKKLDELSAETKKLEIIYQQKLDSLEELKKSILQKAFQGEL